MMDKRRIPFFIKALEPGYLPGKNSIKNIKKVVFYYNKVQAPADYH